MEPYRSNMNNRCNPVRQNINQIGNRNSQMSMHTNMPRGSASDSCPRPVMKPNNSEWDCDCKDSNPHMRHFQLGMAYVPMQDWGELYDLEEAHCQGTIFPDLNFIFCGSRGKM